MTSAVFDFAAIAQRRAQMNGDTSSGRRFEPDAEGKLKDVGMRHDFSYLNGACTRCGFEEIEVEDGIAPKQCSGKKPKAAERIFRNSGMETWRHPDGSRFTIGIGATLEQTKRFKEWKVYGIAGAPVRSACRSPDTAGNTLSRPLTPASFGALSGDESQVCAQKSLEQRFADLFADLQRSPAPLLAPVIFVREGSVKVWPKVGGFAEVDADFADLTASGGNGCNKCGTNPKTDE